LKTSHKKAKRIFAEFRFKYKTLRAIHDRSNLWKAKTNLKVHIMIIKIV